MVKEWATVVRWQDGRAVLRYGSSAGCGSCKAWRHAALIC